MMQAEGQLSKDFFAASGGFGSATGLHPGLTKPRYALGERGGTLDGDRRAGNTRVLTARTGNAVESGVGER
jgi:hypothetical protein